MRSPDRRQRETPDGIRGSHKGRDTAPTESPRPPFPTLDHESPTTVDLVYPIVALLAEVRPDIPSSVAASLAVEVLDLAACMHLDGQWAEARQAVWPEAIKAARSRYQTPYAVRRAQEWADVPAKPGDYMGRPEHGEVA